MSNGSSMVKSAQRLNDRLIRNRKASQSFSFIISVVRLDEAMAAPHPNVEI
jgi:hypothetical protein